MEVTGISYQNGKCLGPNFQPLVALYPLFFLIAFLYQPFTQPVWLKLQAIQVFVIHL